MTTTPLAQKIDYLISKESPLRKIRKVKLTSQAQDIFGIDYFKLRRWAKGLATPTTGELDLLARSVSHSFGLKLHRSFFDDSVRQLEFTRTILTQLNIGDSTPTAPHGRFFFDDFYMPKDKALELFDRIKGIYLLYRRELSDLSKGVVGQGTLAVSHIEKDKHGHCIMSSLNIPHYSGTGYFSYTGTVTQVGPIYYWVFNEKASRFPDYIFMITDSGRYELDVPERFVGFYATMNQDDPPKAVGRRVLLERSARKDDLADTQNKMVADCRLLTEWRDVPDAVAALIFPD